MSKRADGLCECGCGKPAPIANRNRYSRGVRKGEPQRFIHNHHSGPHGPNWAGEDVGYYGLHVWLKKHHPKSGRCYECGQMAEPTDWAFLHHPAPHTRDINDYRELCRTCHKRFDIWMRKVAA